MHKRCFQWIILYFVPRKQTVEDGLISESMTFTDFYYFINISFFFFFYLMFIPIICLAESYASKLIQHVK